ncbi:MAG: MlaD family protein [Rhodococcus sp. (in: high G+C Gram-positive bacteria)]|uniref:MCE family protein n=1 Tax=Rhodococcus sp. TaxID=1831 RepID=UPI003BB17BF1
MTLTRTVRIQLMVFAILTVLGVTYSTFNYAGLQRFTGIGTYTVEAEFTDASGLYVNGIVTYRGIDIGTVTDIATAPVGAVATMQLRSGTDVPAGTTAQIRSVSAIGEQNIDLQPTTTVGPYLGDGDVIPVGRTSVPTSASTLLTNADEFLQSIPLNALRTTLDEASAAFDGTGPALGRLIDSSGGILEDAQKTIDPTLRLLSDGETLLDVGNEISGDVGSFTSDLASFTQQLRMNDEQIRSTLDVGPEFAATVGGTLNDIRPATQLLLENLQSVGQVFEVNLPNLRHILVVYPALASIASYAHQGMQLSGDPNEPQGPLDVKLADTQQAGPCTVGFEDIERRDPSDLSPAEPSTNTYCRLPQDDPRSVRGARNLPCATNPSVRTAEISECPKGLPSTWPGMLSRPGQPGAQQQEPPAGVVAPAGLDSGTYDTRSYDAVPYDPATGRFIAPDGVTYTLTEAAEATSRGSTPESEEDAKWQSLLLNPVLT